MGAQQLTVMCRNPTSESEFEKRSLCRLLACGEELWEA
jgi:hypothetical protein